METHSNHPATKWTCITVLFVFSSKENKKLWEQKNEAFPRKNAFLSFTQRPDRVTGYVLAIIKSWHMLELQAQVCHKPGNKYKCLENFLPI